MLDDHSHFYLCPVPSGTGSSKVGSVTSIATTPHSTYSITMQLRVNCTPEDGMPLITLVPPDEEGQLEDIPIEQHAALFLDAVPKSSKDGADEDNDEDYNDDDDDERKLRSGPIELTMADRMNPETRGARLAGEQCAFLEQGASNDRGGEKKQPKPKLHLQTGWWEALTLVVDNLNHEAVVYLNGVRLKHWKAPGQFHSTGPFSLYPQQGLKFFDPSYTHGLEGDCIFLREIRVAHRVLQEEEVRKLHMHYGAWECENEECQMKYNGAGRTSCVFCSKQRVVSAKPPAQNPDPQTGVHTLVAKKFVQQVVHWAQLTGAACVLYYRKSTVDEHWLSCWQRLASLLKSTDVRVGMFDMDANSLAEVLLGGSKNQRLSTRQRNSLQPDGVPALSIVRRVGAIKNEDADLTVPWRVVRIADADARPDKLLWDELLAFAKSALVDCIVGFDLETHLEEALHREALSYWKAHGIANWMRTVRREILRHAQQVGSSTSAHDTTRPRPKLDMMRFLAMILNGGIDASAGAEERDEQAEAAAVEDAPAGDVETLIASVLFSRANSRKDWGVLLAAERPPSEGGQTLEAQLNGALRGMLSELLRSQPVDGPAEFCAGWLLRQPRYAASHAHEPPPRTSASPMGDSEVARNWDEVRQICRGSVRESERLKLVNYNLRMLLHRGLPLEAAPYGYSMLYMASAQGNFELVKALLAARADMQVAASTHDAGLVWPLEVAASMGNSDVVRLLVDEGAHFGKALHFASAAGHVTCATCLCAAGMAVNAASVWGGVSYMPLELALTNEHGAVANELVLSHGADVSALDEELQNSPLLRSQEKADLEREKGHQETKALAFHKVCRALQHAQAHEGEPLPTHLTTDLDADAVDPMGWTALMHAALSDDAAAARRLLKLGADPLHRTEHGELSAMMWAHYHKSASFIAVLAEWGAAEDLGSSLSSAERDLSSEDQRGLARLHAAYSECNEANRLMLEPGCFHGDEANSNWDDSAQAAHPPQADPSEASRLGDVESSTSTQRVDHGELADLDEEAQAAVPPLEAYLRQVEQRSPGVWPRGSGRYQRRMIPFIQSMKIMVQYLFAADVVPEGVRPVDVFAMHLYTRSELFAEINRALRDGDQEGIERWRPVVWHICEAQRRLPKHVGATFRGISNLFTFVPVVKFGKGEVVVWPSFTSSTFDVRTASNFMYGSGDASKAEGVIFKIWGRASASIEWCSFVPEERERLFLPNTACTRAGPPTQDWQGAVSLPCWASNPGLAGDRLPSLLLSAPLAYQSSRLFAPHREKSGCSAGTRPRRQSCNAASSGSARVPPSCSTRSTWSSRWPCATCTVRPYFTSSCTTPRSSWSRCRSSMPRRRRRRPTEQLPSKTSSVKRTVVRFGALTP